MKRIYKFSAVIVSFAALLLVGLAIISLVMREEYVLTIKNESAAVIANVVLKGQGFGSKLSLGSIPPGSVIQHSFYTGPDGPLEFEATWEGEIHTGVVEGYLTSGIGGNGELIFKQSGEIVIKNMFDESAYNKSLLPMPLTPLAFAPVVKGSLALLGTAEFNR